MLIKVLWLPMLVISSCSSLPLVLDQARQCGASSLLKNITQRVQRNAQNNCICTHAFIRFANGLMPGETQFLPVLPQVPCGGAT